MNDEITPHRLSPEEAALERQLERLSPRRPRAGLGEELLAPLGRREGDEEAMEQALSSGLRPSSPPADLWDRIESQIQEPEQAESAPTSKITAFPQWNEFIPVFRVAATLAIGVFIAAAWLRPGAHPRSHHAQIPATGPKSTTPKVMDAPSDLGKVVPIGRHGSIQGMRSEGVVKMDDQFYERYWQTRKDRTFYRFDGDLQVEDEVSREGPVVTPLRTF